MKTTIEIPDLLFRKAKATAASQGLSLKQFVTEALRERLGGEARGEQVTEPAWMAGFGKLRTLRKETARIQAEIDAEFEQVEPEDRA